MANLQLVSALKKFIQNVYYGEGLSDNQARTNLEEGLVEMVYGNGSHASNGLLLTDDGYFLTSRHCVDREDFSKEGIELETLKIKLHGGRKYPIKSVCVRSTRDLDIAIAKADIPGDCNPKTYRFCNKKYADNSPVALFTRWQGEKNKKYGVVKKMNSKAYLGLSLMTCRQGDSGGIIVNSESRVMGVLSGMWQGEAFYNARSIALFKVLELVDFYRRRIESRQ
jgi:hypothetical protein